VKHLGDDVRRELARFGAEVEVAELVEAWPALVGDTIARNAWPARVARDGTLHVHTADSIWAFELTNRATEIAARAGFDRVRFAAGRLPTPSPVELHGRPKRSVRPSADDRAQAEQLAAGIADENLRKVVARAAAASLARAVADRPV
jgi:hypothetical protein